VYYVLPKTITFERHGSSFDADRSAALLYLALRPGRTERACLRFAGDEVIEKEADVAGSFRRILQ